MKERNLKIIFFTIIIILMIFAIYYIIKNKETTNKIIKITRKENKINNEITVGTTSFDTLNPIVSKNQDIQYISKLIYEPLINIGQDFSLKEALATEWSKLTETTYLIRLNENKIWHNGEKFTAKDVGYTIDYINKNDSIYKDNVKNIEKLEIINDYIIKIYLLKPEENFEYILCFPIICKMQNIGTGEFNIVTVNENEIVLESKTNEKKIIFKIYKDVAKLYNAFSQEEIDALITANINYEKYIGSIGYNKKIICNRNFDYLKFNIKEPEVVQAILYAINKNEIIYKVYNNLYCKAEFPLQYGSYLYKENIEYEYKVNKAKQILKEAGWKENRKNMEKKWQKFKFNNYNK